MSWKARLLMGLMLVAMLMAIAGPAMADHTQRHENRQDRWEDRWDERWDDVEFEVEEFEVDELFFPFFVLEVEDVDCDGVDDDGDGGIDEDVVCIVEFEVEEWGEWEEWEWID